MNGMGGVLLGYGLMGLAILIAMVASRLTPLVRLRRAARLRHSAVKRGALVFASEGALLFVLVALIAPHTHMREYLYLPFVIALALLGFGAYVQQEHRRGGPQDAKACAKCKYPRPEERAPHSEVCSECGNRWWDAPWSDGLRFWDRENRHGSRTLRSAQRKRDTHVCMKISMVVFTVIVCGDFALRFGAVQQHLPTGVVRLIAMHPDDHASGEAVATLLREDRLAQQEADALLERLITERRRPSDAITNAGEDLERAITRGVFTPALLDRFFSESIEYTLEARVSADGLTVEPVVYMRAWARTIEFNPFVVSPGLRINEGAWEQPLTSPQRASEIAQTYDDYWLLRGHTAGHDTHAWRAQIGGWAAPFAPLSTAGLPPGEHTLTLRVHLSSVGGTGPQSHAYLGADGAITPHPLAVWSETRDLTATFTIPE